MKLFLMFVLAFALTACAALTEMTGIQGFGIETADGQKAECTVPDANGIQTCSSTDAKGNKISWTVDTTKPAPVAE